MATFKRQTCQRVSNYVRARTMPPAVWVSAAVALLAIRWIVSDGRGMRQILAVAALTLFLIAIFRVGEGRFHFDFIGLRMRGAAAALVLWLVSFAVVLIALRTFG